MMKKKDKLLDILKKDEEFHLMDFLDIADIHELSLINKKYYMQMLPILQVRKLDCIDNIGTYKEKEIKKSKKNKNVEKTKH